MSSDAHDVCTICHTPFALGMLPRHLADERCRTVEELRYHGWSVRSDGAWTLMIRGERSGQTPQGRPIFQVPA